MKIITHPNTIKLFITNLTVYILFQLALNYGENIA